MTIDLVGNDHNKGNRDLNVHRFKYDDVTRRIKIEAPTFDGAVFDWLVDMDCF